MTNGFVFLMGRSLTLFDYYIARCQLPFAAEVACNGGNPPSPRLWRTSPTPLPASVVVFIWRGGDFGAAACEGKKLKRGHIPAIVKRMKAKLLGLLLVFALLLPFRALAEIDDAPKGQNALRKFGRGLANVLFGIVEVPNQITKVTSEQGGGAGATYGVGKGIYRWFGRELTGVYDIVTFPVPFPKGYKPIMHPEFPVEDYEP